MNATQINQTNNAPKGEKGDIMSTDINFDFGSFSKTTVTVSGNSLIGKAFVEKVFGTAVVSVEIPKSKITDFYDYCEDNGMIVPR